MHPAVHSEVFRRIVELEKDESSGIIIVDAALLVENGHQDYFDRLIVVTCDPNLQLARIVKRDGISIAGGKSEKGGTDADRRKAKTG